MKFVRKQQLAAIANSSSLALLSTSTSRNLFSRLTYIDQPTKVVNPLMEPNQMPERSLGHRPRSAMDEFDSKVRQGGDVSGEILNVFAESTKLMLPSVNDLATFLDQPPPDDDLSSIYSRRHRYRISDR
ncbi:hypothetical protein BC938DRAFT_476049 [Jimgerdemannia flammicorona]|uniref:Uncharacterized protein n=1 Tax=Jimgerdemannia flammicorona TaxID=994334 RepID=A0A433QR16_9FUNG|nr:hypothetical protein BC938DRAFT_476049 [Jimgerdemannia flammicorona]